MGGDHLFDSIVVCAFKISMKIVIPDAVFILVRKAALELEQVELFAWELALNGNEN